VVGIYFKIFVFLLLQSPSKKVFVTAKLSL